MFFSSVVYSSALDKDSIIWSSCESPKPLEAIDICEAAYMNRTTLRNPFSASQVKNCGSKVCGDEVLRYSGDRMRPEIENNQANGREYGDSSKTINPEMQSSRPCLIHDEYAATKQHFR